MRDSRRADFIVDPASSLRLGLRRPQRFGPRRLADPDVAVGEALGEWGARWLEIAPENLDPFVALWSMCNALRRDRLPDRRVVIRFDFTGRPGRERYWLLIELGDTEICKTCPGVDEDLYITADAEAFVKWHAGQLTWAQATREGRIQLDGSPSLVRAFPTWNARSMFADIRPVSRTATSPAG